jgi:hypothetical protein
MDSYREQGMSDIGELVAAAANDARVPLDEPRATGGARTRYEWLALLAAVLPIIVAVTRALATPWRPTYDASYYPVRALDVLTSHHPLVGAWSTLSYISGEVFNNLGPLQLLLLAPFVRLDPFWGAALGIGVVNILAVFAAWLASRRLFGPVGVIGVMGATLVLEACFGQYAWIDARPQLALLLPFWAFLWLTAAMMEGHDAAVFPWVLAGSLVVQTHFSYAYMGLALVVLGGSGYLWTNHRRWPTPRFRLHLIGGLAWALLLWSHPIWDQLFGDQNLSAVLAHSGGERSVGPLDGWRVIGEGPLAFPFWWPDSVSRFRSPWSASSWYGLVVLLAWLAPLIALLVVSIRRRDHLLRVLSVISLVLLMSAWVTAGRAADDLPQNYFWLWPVSLFAGTSLIAAGARLVQPVSPRFAVGAVGLVGLAVFVVPSELTFDDWALPSELDDSGARTSLDRLGDRVDAIRGELGQAVVIEPSDDRLLAPDYYNVLGVLRDRDIDVHFVRGSHDLFRFGSDRCEDGQERARLHVVVGPPPAELPGGSTVLLETPGPAAELVDEARSLDREMEALFDRGAFRLVAGRLDELGPAGSGLRAILERPGEPHPLLWSYLGTAVDAGAARVPEGYERAFSRWQELYFVLYTAKYSVYVTPNDQAPGAECDPP